MGAIIFEDTEDAWGLDGKIKALRHKGKPW